MKLKILLFLFFSQVFISAQIDTTDFFPLEIGNYWEYSAINNSGPKYFSLTVIGDTLMSNGHIYKILKKRDVISKNINPLHNGFTWYFRKDSNKVYSYFGDSLNCFNREYKYLDFSLPDSTVWKICRDLGTGVGNARGIAYTLYDYSYYNYLQKPLETKQFGDVYIDTLTSDTLWTPGDGSRRILIAKGIGIVSQFLLNDGVYWLQGAIINGVNLGTITSIEDVDKLPKDFKLFQNYPNPFNPSTEISWQLAAGSYVTVKVYDVLGRVVATLVNENKPAGFYTVNFNASKLSSGIYFYTIKSNNFFDSKKMILLR